MEIAVVWGLGEDNVYTRGESVAAGWRRVAVIVYSQWSRELTC